MSSESVFGQTFCVIGDTHGHLQLGLCMAARWQLELGVVFDGVFLCGDVGTFTAEEQLDNATRRHGKANPCELEFLYQWSADPQPRWLARPLPPPPKGCPGFSGNLRHGIMNGSHRLLSGGDEPPSGGASLCASWKTC